MEKLSSTLKQLLVTANISEAELARRTGIAQPMVNRLATGKNKNPKLETLKPIAKYFSVTFSQLLGEEDLPSTDGASANSSHSFQLPMANWDSLDFNNPNNINSGLVIATTAKVSDQAFAVLINNSQFEPRFPANTTLTIEPTAKLSNNDFVLVKKLEAQQLLLAQVKLDSNNNTTLKDLNNINSSAQEITLDDTKHQVVGVLVQTSYDFK